MSEHDSLLESLLSLPNEKRSKFLARLKPDEAEAFLYDWRIWARDKQLAPPGDWLVWLVLAGRGFGKTRIGAEWVRGNPQPAAGERIALVGATAADVRDVMVEGESGILACCPPSCRPLYEPSKRRLTWPNGAMATTYSADEPERLRGPQHNRAWVDEIASWRYPDAWDQLMFGLRLGSRPRVLVTGTPKPIKLVRDLVKSPTTQVTRGSTYENRANLAPTFFDQVTKKYEGTRLGRQELEAEILEDTPGALWQRNQIDADRVGTMPPMRRVVVAIDPSVTSSEESDEAGIIAAGLGEDGIGYVLRDETLRGTPDNWARVAVNLFHSLQADRIVAEVNNGGEMVELTIRTIDKDVPYTGVHASRSKHTRAEPVSALYEQHRVRHVGFFERLEDELCTWVPGAGYSPGRMDALVWALTELMLGGAGEPGIRSL